MNKQRIALASALIFGLTSLCHAQTTTASITGTAIDPSGAVVPNVKITATNNDTGSSHPTTSNDSGVFNLLFLPVGSYSIAAESQGFKRTVLGPFALEVNQIAKVDLKLEVGDTTQSVQIRSSRPSCRRNPPRLARRLHPRVFPRCP